MCSCTIFFYPISSFKSAVHIKQKSAFTKMSHSHFLRMLESYNNCLIFVFRICMQRQKISEDHLPGKATDTLTKASLDDSGKEGI